MLQDAVHFAAMMILVLAAMKITAAFFVHRNPDSAIGHGIDWFLTPA